MAEKVLFNHPRGVQVTTARLVTPEKSYAMRSIESVENVQSSKPQLVVIALFFAGLFIVAVGSVVTCTAGVIGIILVVIGGAMFGVSIVARIEPVREYAVVISTASGKQRVISSRDQQFILALTAAINQAIAS